MNQQYNQIKSHRNKQTKLYSLGVKQNLISNQLDKIQQQSQNFNEVEKSIYKIIKKLLQQPLAKVNSSLQRLQMKQQQIVSRQNQTAQLITNLNKQCQFIGSSVGILLKQTPNPLINTELHSQYKLTPVRKIINIRKQQQSQQQNQRSQTPEFRRSNKIEQLQNGIKSQTNKSETNKRVTKFYQIKKQSKYKQQQVVQISPQFKTIVESSVILQSLHNANNIVANLATALKQRNRDIINSLKLNKLFQFPTPIGAQYNPKFHSFIHKRPNILLLVQLKHLRTILAGFTAIPFMKRNIPEPNQPAFIANLSKNRIYKPKNICKSICFDENFLLFGNSEIRIKVRQEKIYSNFGISKGFFQNGNDGLAQFVEQDNQQEFSQVKRENRFEQKIEQEKQVKKKSRREFQIIRYQIFQIIQNNQGG